MMFPQLVKIIFIMYLLGICQGLMKSEDHYVQRIPEAKQSDLVYLGQWENKLYFLGTQNRTTFHAAKDLCISANMRMAMPLTVPERAALYDLIPSSAWYVGPWVNAGLVGIGDQARPNYYWYPNRTNLAQDLQVFQAPQHELCLAMYFRSTWYAIPCIYEAARTLCELTI